MTPQPGLSPGQRKIFSKGLEANGAVVLDSADAGDGNAASSASLLPNASQLLMSAAKTSSGTYSRPLPCMFLWSFPPHVFATIPHKITLVSLLLAHHGPNFTAFFLASARSGPRDYFPTL